MIDIDLTGAIGRRYRRQDEVGTPLCVTIDFDSLAAKRTMLGSGGFVVMDDTACMVNCARTLTRFFEHESCGQCTPCREGGQWVARMVARLEAGEGSEEDLRVLNVINNTITGTNLCPLGDSIMPFLSSVLARFPDGVSPPGMLAGMQSAGGRSLQAAD